MKKADISGRVATRLRLGKTEAEAAVDTVFEAIGDSLAREEVVRIAGFGTFATRSREARMGRNSGPGETVAIPASKAPSFKAGKALRDRVKRGPKPEAEEQPDGGNRGRRGRAETERALDVSVWPGGLEPVRKLLDRESVLALGNEPSAENRALRLATDLTEAELAGSAFVRNAVILLGEIGGEDTVWMTSDGRLNKAGVARMRALMSWPGMEAAEQFRAGKSYYEQQVGELHLLRSVMNMAGLIEPGAFWFNLTPRGREMLEPGRRGALLALLFRQAFWHRDLSKFVSGRPRNLPGWWPQGDIGVVLWSISAVAADWQNAATLTALCTVPDDTMPTAAHWDPAATMFARHILDPLRWFGLVEYRGPEVSFDVRWRKTALFDRFLSFDVRFADGRTKGH